MRSKGILILILQFFIVRKIIFKISFFKFKICTNLGRKLGRNLHIRFGNHRPDSSLLLDVFNVVVMDIDLSDNQVNVHAISNEVSFVLSRGSGKERIERKL